MPKEYNDRLFLTIADLKVQKILKQNEIDYITQTLFLENGRGLNSSYKNIDAITLEMLTMAIYDLLEIEEQLLLTNKKWRERQKTHTPVLYDYLGNLWDEEPEATDD